MSSSKDIQLRTKVQDKISKDLEFSKLYDVHVDVHQGEVRLAGVVDTLSEKERLENMIRDIPEVSQFMNDIVISTDGPITDRGVEFEVAEELYADEQVNPKHIGAKGIQGRTFLVGHSADQDEIQGAKNDAARARGVKEIISQVKPKKKDPIEHTFHNQVRNDDETYEC